MRVDVIETPGLGDRSSVVSDGQVRASIAASILARAGHDAVHLDDAYANAEKAGLFMVDA